MRTASSINDDFDFSWGEEADNAATVINHPNRPDYCYKDIIANNSLPKALKSSRTDPIKCEIIPFPSSGSPFDQIDEIYIDDDHKALSVIKNIPKSLKLEHAQRIANRLQYLYDVSKEDDPDEIAISSQSMECFLKFFAQDERFGYPDIALTPSKNILVEWRIGPDQNFAIEFLSKNDTYFALFAPDPKHPERVARVSGSVSIDSVLDIIKPYGILSWILR
ncbi:MAG: hypothetical protein EHM45_01760 [Desulfobacteraceae bacterium]|nr:MAG: hypothetical protein EHM45_01760 [Desulfobacteraceae bacterium]